MDILLGPSGLVHPHSPFANGFEDRELVEFLKVAQIVKTHRRGAAQGQHWAGIKVGISNTSEEVGRAWSTRPHTYSDLAGNTRVGVRHHRGGLLMAHVDEADTKTFRVHRQEDVRSAHDVEDGIDAFFFETFSNELATIYLRHEKLLQ
jgi:hypothetical protein